MEEEVDLNRGYVARIAQDITAQDVHQWKNKQPFCAELREGTRGYIQNPNEVLDGFQLFQPLVCDEDGWHATKIHSDIRNAIAVPKNRLIPVNNYGSGIKIKGLLPTVHLESTEPSPNDSLLEQLIACFFEGVLENRAALIGAGMTASQLDFLAQEKGRMLKTMIRGFKNAKTFEHFRDGLPSFAELTSKLKSHKELSMQTRIELAKEYVVYVNLYWYKVHDKISGSTYWGQTQQGAVRADGHATWLGEGAPKPKHCKRHYAGANEILVGNDDSGWGWYPILRMKRDSFSQSNRMTMVWAEQAAIALFGGYNKRLINMPSGVGVGEHLWSVGMGRAMQKIVHEILERNDRFQTFDVRKVEGYLGGLNWGSPVLEALRLDSPLWVGELIYGEDGKPLMWSFTGQPRPVRLEKPPGAGVKGTEEYEEYVSTVTSDSFGATGENTNVATEAPELKGSSAKQRAGDLLSVYFFGRIIRKINSSEKRRQPFQPVLFSASQAEEWGLEEGDLVTPKVELMYDEFQTHPESYAALPHVGGFKHWHHANRVGLPIEWEDKTTKTFKKRYIASANKFTFHENLDDSHGTKEELYCMERHFISALSICATFQSWHWKDWKSPEDGLRSDLIEPFSVRVKIATFDVDRHVLTLTDPEPVIMDRPRLLSYDETMRLLKLQYGDYCIVGIPKNGICRDVHGAYFNRQNVFKMCDTCWMPLIDVQWKKEHPDQHKLHFRVCDHMQNRSLRGESTNTCRVIKCDEEWEPGEHPYTCDMCSRLRRWCTYQHGYWLWKEYDSSKTLTLYQREGHFVDKARVMSAPSGLNYMLFGRSRADAEQVLEGMDEAELLEADDIESLGEGGIEL